MTLVLPQPPCILQFEGEKNASNTPHLGHRVPIPLTTGCFRLNLFNEEVRN